MGEHQARPKRRSSFKNLSSSSKSSSSPGTRALARGSSSMVGTRNSPMPSQLSTFQMSEEERSSQLELLTGPRPKVNDGSKIYIFIIIGILLAAVGVLVFLLAL